MDEKKIGLKAMIYTGKGASGPGIPRLIEIMENHDVLTVKACEHRIREINDGSFDLLVIPGGCARIQENSVGSAGMEGIRSFVAHGGGYLGICAGAYLASPLLSVRYLRTFKGQDLRGMLRLVTPEDETLEIMYHNGPFFPPFNLPKGVVSLATVDEGFGPKRQRAKMRRRSSIITGCFSKGRVVLCGPHPEQTPNMEDFTWELFKIAAQSDQIRQNVLEMDVLNSQGLLDLNHHRV